LPGEGEGMRIAGIAVIARNRRDRKEQNLYPTEGVRYTESPTIYPAELERP
jgi:hypothetical protein